MLHPDKLIRMRPVLADTIGAWIEASANAGFSRSHVVRKVKTTAGQTGISGEDIKKMPIPLPPLNEQVVLRETLSTQIDSMRDQLAQVDVALKQAEAQRKNILKAAFAGQLVPQSPNDEPASALLERIRTERIAPGVGRPRGRKARQTDA
jgi:type I restriction enzyme S subunit